MAQWRTWRTWRTCLGIPHWLHLLRQAPGGRPATASRPHHRASCRRGKPRQDGHRSISHPKAARIQPTCDTQTRGLPTENRRNVRKTEISADTKTFYAKDFAEYAFFNIFASEIKSPERGNNPQAKREKVFRNGKLFSNDRNKSFPKQTTFYI